MKVKPFIQTGDPDYPIMVNPKYFKKYKRPWSFSTSTDKEMRYVKSLINLYPHTNNFLFREVRETLENLLTHDFKFEDFLKPSGKVEPPHVTPTWNEMQQSLYKYWVGIAKLISLLTFDFFGVEPMFFHKPEIFEQRRDILIKFSQQHRLTTC